MTTPEEIQNQQERLQIARRVLVIFLQQLAMLGTANAQPSLFTSIREGRPHIRQTKNSFAFGIVKLKTSSTTKLRTLKFL